MGEKKYQFRLLRAVTLSMAIAFTLISSPLKTAAQSDSSSGENISPDVPDTIQRTIPKPREPLPPLNPQPQPKPNLKLPIVPQSSECIRSNNRKLPSDNDGELFYVRNVEVVGNTVLQSEIETEISKFKRHVVTFEDLVCLRSKITNLYLSNGYITSGAFIPNNQDLNDGVVKIQVVEGEAEIALKGLNRLRAGYVRSRLQSATNKPLNRQRLEESLQLLLLDPLIKRVDAELTASNTTGKNILLLDIQEADTFLTSINGDNYRSPSIGETQLTASLTNSNLIGFGDLLSGSYSFTEGLDLYDINYTIPFNAQDGNFSFSYSDSNSSIVDDEFQELDIESETNSFSFGVRQPVVKSSNQEFALGLNLNLRRRQTFLDDQPFSFSAGLLNGESKTTVLGFSQEWINRQSTRVLAVRSQFNLGIDAFDATVNDTTDVDGTFFAWQGQFQWLQQLSARTVLVTRLGSQLTPNSLLSLEKFSLGGINTIRGYAENQLVTDNGIFSSTELRIPVTADPEILQLTPFLEVGAGWNNQESDSDLTTLASFGLGLRWSITSHLRTSLDYGIPLINTNDEGDSLQENGFNWSFSYQPF